MKRLIFVFLSLICFCAFAEDNNSNQQNQQCISLFSTTVDWEGVTGLRLHQYTGKVGGTSRFLVKEGLVLYYLDAFPCYGEADSVRVWLSPTGKMSGNLRIICIHKPETISFAYRNATEEAVDGRSIGILTCPIEGNRNFKIDISKCIRGKNWTEYK